MKHLGLLLLVNTFLLSSLLFSQTIPTSVAAARDAAAVAAVQQAIQATGTPATVPNGAAIKLSGQMQRASNGEQVSFTVTYLVVGGSVMFRRDHTTSKGTMTIASGGGNPVNVRPDGTVRKLSSYVLMANAPFELPGIVLALESQNPNYSIQLVAPSSASSPTHIRTQDQSSDLSRLVTTQDWYFDPASGMPIRVEYKLPDIYDATVADKGSCDYVGFTNISGVSVPAQMNVFETGQLVDTITIQTVTPNAVVPTNFDLSGTN